MQQLLLEQALQIVADCTCPFGCPSCAGPMGEIGTNGKRTAYELLKELTR
jgi:DEAD/DEAH box helicase domain-containing protein